MSPIFVTGGAGYLGSHTVLALLQAGHEVTVLDNFSNSSNESLRRVALLAGRAPTVINGDVRDATALGSALSTRKFYGVMHFAGLKSVSGSFVHALDYYSCNLAGSLCLLEAMKEAGVFRFVFSSSATVYGTKIEVPVREAHPLGEQVNPYGRTKAFVEALLRDLVASDPRWHVGILRYFNPVGAEASGTIGEDPRGIPNNLVPYICQVAANRRPALRVFGNDYPTRDGTGVRDYIHVLDLARGHLLALAALESRRGLNVWNLGRGEGFSVLEVVRAFERASGKKIACEFVDRRLGDVAECWADPTLAANELRWKASLGLDRMVADAWRWQKQNPTGYAQGDPTE